jgi:thymidylate synthase (FAD)
VPIVIKPSVAIEKSYKSGLEIIRNIEKYGRVCYRSESKTKENSAENFVRSAIKRGHFSIIEHEKMTARIICDRGVSHEIVRHRVGSYSQESTRYCDYSKDGSMQVIEPFFFADNREKYEDWLDAMRNAEAAYKDLRGLGATPEEARSVLPNSLKTEMVVTYNLREWRHFFYLRGSKGSHPQIRQIAIMLLEKIKEYVPVIFDDFIVDKTNNIASTSICPAS